MISYLQRFASAIALTFPEPLCFNKIIVYLSTEICTKAFSPSLPVDRVVFACDNLSLK